MRVSEAGEHAGMRGKVPVYPGKMVSNLLLLRVGASGVRRPANATIKVNLVEGGMCVALDTSGAAFAAGAALIIGLHDDDDSVSR